MATSTPRPRLERAIDNAVVGGRTTYLAISQTLEEYRSAGRKGAAILRAVLDARLGLAVGSKSDLQLRLLKVAEQANVRQPEVEYEIWLQGKQSFLDAAWPKQKLVVEMDGFNAHGLSRKRFDDDRRRNNRLVADGWILFHFTWHMSDAEIRAKLRRFFEGVND